MAEKFQIASPCSSNWELMAGDNRVRYCSQCNLNVYNFREMTKRELKQLVREREGMRLCGRLYRRTDGTVITKDSQPPSKSSLIRASRLAVASLSAAMSVCVATAQTPAPRSLVQIAPVESGIELQVLDPSGAGIHGASVSLTGENLKTPISGTTDDKGNWQTHGIAPGQYNLCIQTPGFSSSLHTVSVVPNSVSRLQIKQELAVLMGEVVTIQPHQNPAKRLLHFLKGI